MVTQKSKFAKCGILQVFMLMIPYHCFSLLDNTLVLSDVPAWTNSTDLVCSILVFVTFSSMNSELKTKRVFLSLSPQPVNATWSNLTKEQCLRYGGRLEGETCGFVPDITLMSFILFFGTYACSMALKQFKTSRFFPTTVSDSACLNVSFNSAHKTPEWLVYCRGSESIRSMLAA